ncbi:MMPL family transporter [bacterium]|nr:MMPL family transporter [bacterium]
MSRRAITLIGRRSVRSPLLSLAVVAILTALAAWAALTRLRIEMDVAALLPQDSEVARNTRIAEWDFGRQEYLIAVAEIRDDAPEDVRASGSERLLAIRGELESALMDPTIFRRIGASFGENTFGAVPDVVSVARLTDPDLTAIEARLSPANVERTVAAIATKVAANSSTESLRALQSDPLGIGPLIDSQGRLTAGPLRGVDTDGAYLSTDGQMMLLVLWPLASPTDLVLSQELKSFLDKTTAGLFERNPSWKKQFRISFTGPHIENASGEFDIRSDVTSTSLVSFIAVLLLFLVAFRQPEGVLLVAIPLAVGVVWTMGIASLFLDRITQVTLTFAAIMIGLSIDFSIHFYNRFTDDMRGGKSVEDALRIAIHQTGPSIVAGAITTGVAFFAMMLTRFEGFRQLGLFGGIGIIACLVANAATLPALIIISSRLTRHARRPMATFGLKKVAFAVLAYPRMAVAAGLCVAVFFGFYATKAEFNEDFQSLRQPNDEYQALLARIGAHFEVPGNPVIVILEAHTLEEALAMNDRVFDNAMVARSLYDIVSIDSLRYVFPGEAAQRQSLSRFSGIEVNRLRADLERRSIAAGIPAEFFKPTLDRLEELVVHSRMALAATEPPITSAMTADPAFYGALLRYMVSDRSREQVRVITRIYPRRGLWVEGVPRLFKDRLATDLATESNPAPLTVLGNDVLSAELRGVITRDLAIVLLVVIAGIYFYLAFYFRRLYRALLAMLPVFFAILCMLGTMYMLGIQFTYLNVIVLPMIIGIGVDNSIHLLERFYEPGHHTLRLAVEKTGRGVMITSLTTIFGFGSLCVASFQGIREIGLLSIVGTIAVLFATLVFLPALLRLTNPEVTFQGGSGDEIG